MAAVLLLVMMMTGCPGLMDTDSVVAGSSNAGSSGSGGSGGAGGSISSCESDCMSKILTGAPLSCKACHSSVPPPNGAQLAGLDLQTPGYTARLRESPAKHTDLGPGMTAADCSTNDKLIDTVNPSASWLYKKVAGKQGTCGTPMPQSPPYLTPSELACVETYLGCVAGKPFGSQGGATGAPAAAGGGGAGAGGAAGSAAGGGGGTSLMP